MIIDQNGSHSSTVRVLPDYFEEGTISLAIKGIDNDKSYSNDVEIVNNVALFSCLDLESQQETRENS